MMGPIRSRDYYILSKHYLTTRVKCLITSDVKLMFQISRGLSKKHGENRVIDTPISEVIS
jgi:hypothetical protein